MKNAYLATDDEGRQVVLKVVREPIATDDDDGTVTFPERIQREIDGMRSLDHPRIVKVLDGPAIREIDGENRVWYIKPFYPGGTLADRLFAPWSHGMILDLLRSLTEAIEALAMHGTVHRDIKPGNIVFDENDQPVLLDLGNAYFSDLTPITESWGHSPRTLPRPGGSRAVGDNPTSRRGSASGSGDQRIPPSRSQTTQ